jgi:hypothetical protein
VEGGRGFFPTAFFLWRTGRRRFRLTRPGLFLAPLAQRGFLIRAVSKPVSHLLTFLSVVGFVGVVFLTLTAPERPAKGQPHVPPLLPRASLLRVAGRAFLPVIADYYWLAAIQATGKANSAAEYRDIADYAQLITDIDPDFAYVYQFGAVMVPFNNGREVWSNAPESTALLEKGVARFPGSVFLRTLLAYNYSVLQKQYARAAHLLEETARLPGAPNYLPLLATRLYSQAGDFDAASAFADQFAANAADPETRAAFEHRTKEIALERILQTVDRAVEAFRERTGRLPDDLKELVASRVLTSIPSDPLEGELYLGTDGRAYSTSQQHRLEVYDPIKDNPQK